MSTLNRNQLILIRVRINRSKIIHVNRTRSMYNQFTKSVRRIRCSRIRSTHNTITKYINDYSVRSNFVQ